MKPNALTFRSRTESNILSAIDTRIHLIQKKFTNGLTTEQCQQLKEQLQNLQTDEEYVAWVVRNYPTLMSVFPGANMSSNCKIGIVAIIKEAKALYSA